MKAHLNFGLEYPLSESQHECHNYVSFAWAMIKEQELGAKLHLHMLKGLCCYFSQNKIWEQAKRLLRKKQYQKPKFIS
jgi:hypothetical protein